MKANIIILLMVMIFGGGCSVNSSDCLQCWYQEGVVTSHRFEQDFSECKNEGFIKALNDELTPEEFDTIHNQMFEECMQLKGYRVLNFEDDEEFADVNEAFCTSDSGGIVRFSPNEWKKAWDKK